MVRHESTMRGLGGSKGPRITVGRWLIPCHPRNQSHPAIPTPLAPCDPSRLTAEGPAPRPRCRLPPAFPTGNVDPTMALRMTNYVTTIWMQLEADDLGPGGEFPFVLPIVIYNGGRPWTAATDIADLPAQMPKATLGYMLRHRYLLIEIQTEDPEQLPPDNVLAMIAKFEQAPTAEATEELIRSLPEWIKSIRMPELTEPFLRWIEQVVTERYGESGRELRRNLRREGEPKVTTLLDRARQWGKERDEHWLQKGLEKGIKEERRASLQRERELVHRQVTRKFGSGTAEQLLPLLDRLSDPASIVAIAEAVIECETGEEFLQRVREA